MKSKFNLYALINIISFFCVGLLGYFLFNSDFIKPDYFVCTNIVSQDFQISNSLYTFNFPISCDQNEYFVGFYDFNAIIFTENAYQQRPLYIFLVFALNSIFFPLLNILGFGEIVSIYFFVIFIHIQILSLAIIMLLEVLKIKKLTYFDVAMITVLTFLHPLAKWEIFEANNWMFTLLAIILPIYLLQKDSKVSLKGTLLFGLLFMANRSIIASFAAYILIEYIRNKNLDIKNIIKHFIIFFVPYTFYRLYFFINDLPVYDTNAKYFQQFTWIIDYFTWGGDRKYGEYFCQRIPGFIECYLDGTFNLINYLSVPFIFSLISGFILYKKDAPLLNGILISSFTLYAFWSFSGWYPMRFIYYSLGNLINILIIYGFFRLNKNNVSKLLYATPLIIYLLFLTMWNNPVPEEFIDSKYLNISFICIIFYLLCNYKTFNQILKD
tara:strand:- start:481 stop:1797 length:1317 start_codon:yes stop_codon:yes gene_type:complete